MKASPAVAKSYAKALFELASERNQADPIEGELERAAALVAGDRELTAAFDRPWISPAARRKLADEIAQRLELSRLGRDFFDLLAAAGRADHLGAIATAYRAMLDAARGRVRARVRTAVALIEADRAALAQRLGRALGGKQVVIEEVVDPTLLGGFVAEIGDQVMDGSLDGQLSRIRERLAKG
ncbi:MAG TPA: ATP synthase F1 subunit delta [Methylomirabilota bacterium]|nr:ATP synthase F1 subunit delta [Methylomirabilota bacterium]